MATPVTLPDRRARWWVALMSTPTATRRGPASNIDADRAEGLREDDRCSAVQEAVRLGVALHRHRGHQPIGRRFGEDDPHAREQG